MIKIKEHAINKIPFVMSVTKFKIMRSGAKIITIISLPGKEVVKKVTIILALLMFDIHSESICDIAEKKRQKG